MSRKDKKNENKIEAEMMLSINYGNVTASCYADDEKYVAKITGKIGQVEEWRFHQFVIRLLKSIEKASNFKDPV